MVLGMAGATIIGMPLIAWVIMFFFPDFDYFGYMIGEASLWFHLAAGTLAGLGFALGANWLVSRDFMSEVRIKYNALLGDLKLNSSEIIFISFCAGVGEEFLFRGTIQPLLGIIPTAVLFVALHGYLSFRDWRISVYGIYMTGVIAFLGWLTHEYGILSAVIAHTLIDIVLLRKMMKDEADDALQAAVDQDEFNEQ